MKASNLWVISPINKSNCEVAGICAMVSATLAIGVETTLKVTALLRNFILPLASQAVTVAV